MMNVFEKIREKFANIHRVVMSDEDLEWNRAVYKCETLVNQIEQEHNNGWIPCSERLPQEDEPEDTLCEVVNIMLRDGTVTSGWCNRYLGRWFYLDHHSDYPLCVIIGSGLVTHWQPFPQPYKESDTNGN